MLPRQYNAGVIPDLPSDLKPLGKLRYGRAHGIRATPRWRTALFAVVSMTGIIVHSGCSTTKAPTDILAKAEIGLRAAAEARADDLAPVEFHAAQEKVAKAKQAIGAGKHDQARRFAESALVDAELAEAKAELAIVRRAADDVQRRVDALQTEAERESRKPLSPEPNRE
jgi:hypothetical protein